MEVDFAMGQSERRWLGRRRSRLATCCAAAAPLLLSGFASLVHAAPGDTELISATFLGTAGSSSAFADVSVSEDGRYVAFESRALNLALGKTDDYVDVMVRDRLNFQTERISVRVDGGHNNGDSYWPSISADGRYVAFISYATRLVVGDTNGYPDVFVRDRQTGITERVSVDSNGAQLYAICADPAISADGRYVAFTANVGRQDVFVHDRQTGLTEKVSVDSNEVPANAYSFDPAISQDGRFIAFSSNATNLAPGEVNEFRTDVFVRDRRSGITERVSRNSAGIAGDAESLEPAISADGRYVAFSSFASNLAPGETSGSNIYVRDRQTGITERVVSTSPGGPAGGGARLASISADARFVAFMSSDNTLVSGDTNVVDDVFLRDRIAHLTERVSVASDGAQADDYSYGPAISGDGRIIAFASRAGNLVDNDSNGEYDVYAHEHVAVGVSWTLTPSAVAFGNQAKNTFSDLRPVTITNTGTQAIPIIRIALGGGSPSQFGYGDQLCGASLKPGASCRLEVLFHPTSTGSKSARLSVTAGAGGTKSVLLTGTGVDANVAYTVSPSSVSFGNQKKGTSSAARVVQVKNTGTALLSINGVGLGGPSPGQFAETTTCGSVLAVGASCQVFVFFRPATTGIKNATLIVNAGTALKLVPLTGTGVK